MKKLANEFKRYFESLGENTEKYNTFLVSLKREIERIGIKEENQLNQIQ